MPGVYKCYIATCTKSFARPGNLRRHLEQRHRGPADVIMAKFNNGDENPTWKPEPTMMMLIPVGPAIDSYVVKEEEQRSVQGTFPHSSPCLLSTSMSTSHDDAEGTDDSYVKKEEQRNVQEGTFPQYSPYLSSTAISTSHDDDEGTDDVKPVLGGGWDFVDTIHVNPLSTWEAPENERGDKDFNNIVGLSLLGKQAAYDMGGYYAQ